MHEINNKDVGAIDGDCYLLVDAVEDGNFEHVPEPAEPKERLNPGSHVCALFATG